MYNFNTTSIWRRIGILFVFSTSCYEVANCCLIFIFTNLDFTEARESEWQWHQLGHMQVCTSLQTDNHASNPPLSFLQAGCPSCCPTNSVKH